MFIKCPHLESVSSYYNTRCNWISQRVGSLYRQPAADCEVEGISSLRQSLQYVHYCSSWYPNGIYLQGSTAVYKSYNFRYTRQGFQTSLGGCYLPVQLFPASLEGSYKRVQRGSLVVIPGLTGRKLAIRDFKRQYTGDSRLHWKEARYKRLQKTVY